MTDEIKNLKAEVYDLIVAREIRQGEITQIDNLIKERTTKIDELNAASAVEEPVEKSKKK